LATVRQRGDRVERRLRKCLALARLCRQARFDKVTEGRLTEFLQVLGSALDAEAPADPAAVPPPSWVGRVLFRQALALYLRKDHGPDRGIAAQGRLALLGAAWRFARGRGPVPRVHGRLPDVTFERLEAPAGPLPDAAEDLLERYYATKIGSLQFCGPTNFGHGLWDGLESLALTFPVILWLARAFGDRPRAEAVEQAVRVVDDPFGFNPIFGTVRQRLSLSILARRGELEKLIAWYGR
jgi:lysine-N-methylase